MISIILRGGLGNNLYMMTATMCHALKHGFEYAVPLEVDNPHYAGQKPYIFPGIKYCEKLPALPLYREPFYHYHWIPAVDDIILDGYFQSFKYSEGYRKEVLDALGFNWHLEKGWCAIHVRRGDYLKLPDYHPFVGEKYLTDAVRIMNEQKGITNFRVFSNDLPWCRTFFSTLAGYNFDYVDGNTELQDMEQGSWCEHQILSNGTFATWMHYLNQNPDKICIAPQRWFGRFLSHDTKDIYPETSIIIPNE